MLLSTFFIAKARVRTKSIIIICLGLLALCLAYLTGSVYYDKFTQYILTTAFVFTMANLIGNSRAVTFVVFQKMLLIVSLLILVFNFVAGDITFLSQNNDPYNYQGVSKLMGLLAVLLLSNAVLLSAKKFHSIALLVLSVFFLVLSFSAGGRGDFLAALIVCLPISYKVLKKIKLDSILIFLVIGLPIVLLMANYISILISDSLGLQRFLAAINNENLGGRPELIKLIFKLLTEEPFALLFGCGANCFQAYFDFEFGMHPHNLLLEFILSFGVIIAIPVIWQVAACIRQWYRGSSPYLPLYSSAVFFILVGLKSNSLFTSWVTILLIVITLYLPRPLYRLSPAN